MRRILLIVFILWSWGANAQWSQLAGPQGADVRDIERDPVSGNLYLLASNTLYKSTNSATSWQKVNIAAPVNLELNDIAIGANKIFGLTFSALYTSTDDGLNWDKVSQNNQFYSAVRMLRFGPDGFIAVYGYNGLYVSKDAGATWTQILNEYFYEDSKVVANASGDLFAVTTAGIKKYVYPGAGGTFNSANWTTVLANASYSYTMYLGVDASNNIYTTNYSGTAYDILKTTNGGTSWATAKGNLTTTGFRGFWRLFGSRLYLFNTYFLPGNIHYTDNGGTAWTTVTSPVEQYGGSMQSAALTSVSEFYVGGYGPGVLKTTNSGGTFALASGGLNTGYGNQVVVANTTGKIIYLQGPNQSKGYWGSTDNGATFTFTSLPSDVNRVIKLSDGKILFFGSSTLRSTDNGGTFSSVATQLNGIVESSISLLYGVSNSGLYKSVDQGATWTPITLSGMPVSGYSINYNAIAVQSGGTHPFVVLYDYSDSKYKLFKITVSGTTGTAAIVASYPWSGLNYFYPNNLFFQGTRLIITSSEAIYSTTDEGATWTSSSFSGSYVFPITQGAFSGLAVSRQGTLYITQDQGKSWNSSALPTSMATISSMEFSTTGNYFVASANNSPALKFTGNLLVDPATLPPYINFNWESTGGPYGGTVSKSYVDASNNTYVVSNSGLFKTTTFTTWTKVPINDYFNDVTGSGSNLYALSYSTIYKSTNAGVNWTPIANSENISSRYHLRKASNGNLVLVAWTGSAYGIYVSTNDGTTFGAPKLTLGTNNYVRSIDVTSDNVIYLTYETQISGNFTIVIVKSTDNGTTWSAPLTTPVTGICHLSVQGTTLYLSGNGGDAYYKSVDQGVTWTSIKGNLNTSSCNRIFIRPNGELFLFANSGVNYGFFRSTDGGITWAFMGPLGTNGVNSVGWVGTRMVVTADIGVLVSDDNGATFTEKNVGLPSNIRDLHQISSSKVIAAGYQGNFAYDFQNWTRNTGTGPFSFYTSPQSRLFGMGYNYIVESTNGGTSWTNVAKSPEYSLNSLCTANGTMFFAASHNKFYFTNSFTLTNDQTTWTELNPSGMPAVNDRNIYQLLADNNGILYIVLYNYTTSKQEIYQLIFGNSVRLTQVSNPQNMILRTESGVEKVYIYDGTGVIFVTTDGTTFTQKAAPAGNKLVIASNGYYFILNGSSIWLSRDQGTTWQEVGVGGSNIYATDVFVNEYNGRAYASFEGLDVRRSGNVVIPDDGTPPVVATLTPANNATAIDNSTQLSITFDEVVAPVAAKKLRIFESTNTFSPVEEILATAGTQNDKTFTYTLVTPLQYLKTYFVIVENGAFNDIFGNTFLGITGSSVWRFTVEEEPDVTKPTITFTTSNLEKGVAKTFTVTVADNKPVPTDKTKIFYRGITTAANASFTEAALTAGTGSGTTSSQFTVSAQESWYDAMGLEYYFESEDAAGNKERSPSSTTAYHYSYISFTNDNTYPALNSVLSFGGATANYRIVTIPYKLSNASVSTIFDEVNGGIIDPKQIRVFTLGGNNSYTEPTSFSFGKGYWVNIKNNSGNILIEGSQTPEYNRGKFFDLNLTAGWNMIGNPYPVPISWNQVKSGNAAVGSVQTFNGTAYVSGDILQPMQGGFVFVQGTASQTVKVRFQGILTGGRVGESEPGSDLTSSNWGLSIKTESNGMSNHIGGIGMHEAASNGLDQFDDVNPPKFLTLPELSFKNEAAGISFLAKDIIPSVEAHSWKFTAEGGEGMTTLTWNNQAIVTDDQELILFDKNRQVLVDMIKQGSYTFNPAEGNLFEVHYGKQLHDKIKPTAIYLNAPYPNPVQVETTVSFALPENSGLYKVNLEVYNSAGQRVAILAQGNYASGFYKALWHSEGQGNGLYFVRLNVTTGDTPVTLTEKIIINK